MFLLTFAFFFSKPSNLLYISFIALLPVCFFLTFFILNCIKHLMTVFYGCSNGGTFSLFYYMRSVLFIWLLKWWNIQSLLLRAFSLIQMVAQMVEHSVSFTICVQSYSYSVILFGFSFSS